MDGRTVECITGSRTVGSDTLQVAVPLSAPSSAAVTIPNQPAQSFTVTWAPPTNECGSAIIYMYPGLDDTCGQCTGRSDTPSVTCSGWTPEGQSCSIIVRAGNCGGKQGEESEPVVVTLEAAQSPVVEGTPVYNEAGFLWKINLEWIPVASTANIAVFGENVLVDGSIVNYIVESTDDITTDVACSDTRCDATVLLPHGTGEVSLSVAAVNFLGRGDATTVGPYGRVVPPIDSLRTDVTINGSMPQLTVQCPAELNCVSFEYGACDSTISFQAEMTNDFFTTAELNSTTLYCYRLYINIQGVIGIVEGTETYPCSSDGLIPEGDNFAASEECTTNVGLAIFNGDICYPTDLLPSSSATYQCDPGYCLDVPSMEQGTCVNTFDRTCQDDQEFSLRIATCVPMPTCINTKLIFTQINIEQRSAVYRCTEGNEISNPLLMYTPGMGWGEPPCCTDLSVVIQVAVALTCVGLAQIVVGILVILVFCRLQLKSSLNRGIVCGLAFGILLLVPLIGIILAVIPVLVLLCLQCCDDQDTKLLNLTVSEDQPDEEFPDQSHDASALYSDPHTITHEKAPESQDVYAMPDKHTKKPKPEDHLPTYQDPKTIEKTAGPEGDLYTVPEKPKRGSSKKRDPPPLWSHWMCGESCHG